ncbi:unnamed protein product [Camellia sinensis]
MRKVIEKYLQHHNPKLIEGNKFHEETKIAMNCPQQVDHSLDCGVIVCYLMREYVCNKDIFPNLTNEECHQIRADIIEALLTNQQTDTQQIVDEAIEAVLEDKEGNKSVSHEIEALFFSLFTVGESLPLSSKTTNTTQAIRAPNQPIRTKNSRKHACKADVASSRKRLSRPKTRSYTAKRQKREKQDNNETKKQEDNKEETTRTTTTIKQQERVKRQRHQKQEPADEAQKQAEAKEKISEQQQSIEAFS